MRPPRLTCRAHPRPMPNWPIYLPHVFLGATARVSETQGLLAGGFGSRRRAAGEVTSRSGECPSDRPPGLPGASSRHCRLGQGRCPITTSGRSPGLACPSHPSVDFTPLPSLVAGMGRGRHIIRGGGRERNTNTGRTPAGLTLHEIPTGHMGAPWAAGGRGALSAESTGHGHRGTLGPAILHLNH